MTPPPLLWVQQVVDSHWRAWSLAASGPTPLASKDFDTGRPLYLHSTSHSNLTSLQVILTSVNVITTSGGGDLSVLESAPVLSTKHAPTWPIPWETCSKGKGFDAEAGGPLTNDDDDDDDDDWDINSIFAEVGGAVAWTSTWLGPMGSPRLHGRGKWGWVL